MRISVIAALAAIFPCTANAGASEDLTFCGGLKSGHERLACFDAAARIAARPALAKKDAPLPSPAVYDAQAAIPARPPIGPPTGVSQFAGFYAAIGGGYGVGSGRGAFVNSGFGTASFYGDNSQGGHIAAAVGGNIVTSSGLLVGLEFDGRYEGERGYPTGQTTSFLGGNAPAASYEFRSDAAVHAAIRVGSTFDDLLIFAKAGIGAVRFKEALSYDERPINVPLCGGGSFYPCLPVGSVLTAGSFQSATWLPSAIFGVGAEKNWGPIFGRVGAEFEAVNLQSTNIIAGHASGYSSSPQITWASRGSAMIGYRF
ncbi:MAG: hypothetical protein JWL86_632 [Rhizobium sp.]|nr:hypothetical protein [Rhizobium sp.]